MIFEYINLVKLDETTKLFFFLVIVFSNLAFLTYWVVMMYFEVKSVLIKKVGKIYALLCLCGNTEKLKSMLKNIQVKEENETLREKYFDVLKRLQDLQTDGRIILNQRTIEKVQLYLEEDKVLRAAGIDSNVIPVKERDKIDKRMKRKYNTNKIELK